MNIITGPIVYGLTVACIALAALAGWQEVRISHIRGEVVKKELVISKLRTDAAERTAIAERQQRALETELQNLKQGVINDTIRKQRELGTAVAESATGSQRLRAAANRIATRGCQASRDPSPTSGSASAPGAGVLLADVLGETQGRLGEVDAYADDLRIRLEACNRFSTEVKEKQDGSL